MRSTSGINELQSLNTSGVQALRCCGVPCDHAGAAKLGVMTNVAMAIRLQRFISSSPDRIIVRRPNDTLPKRTDYISHFNYAGY